MTKKERERERKQLQWQQENREIDDRWAKAPEVKEALQKKGCRLPFYDTLDSYEVEFKKLVAWAKGEFSSLYEVYEVASDGFDDDWSRLGLPADWVQVFYNCQDVAASTYTIRDTKANLRGSTVGFHDPDGRFRTIVQIIKNPSCRWEHKEFKYLLKLPILLHEIGHVKDYELKLNFDRDHGTADLIEGEVYAHLFALHECFSRAYFMSAGVFLDSIVATKDFADYRGVVARRLLDRFQKPQYREWTDY